MSFSFTIAAATKALALAAVATELDKVVGVQPIHANDRPAVQEAATSAINVLNEPTSEQVVRVSVSGSLAWVGENAFTSASLSVSASISQVT